MAYELTPFRLLLDRVIPTARPHFRVILPTICLPMLVVALPVAWAQQRWIGLTMLLESEELPANLATELVFLFASIAALMLVYVGCYVALTVASMDAVMGRPVDMARAWRETFRVRTLWTTFLYMSVVMISFLMCIAPGLIAVPLFGLTLPVLVAEGKSGVAALRRSAQLIWWNGTGRVADSGFMQMAVLLFVGWLIQTATSSVAQMPMMIYQQVQLLDEVSTGGVMDPNALLAPGWLVFSTQLIAALVAAVTWFYWTFGYSLLYRELQNRRYGADLRAGLEELERAGA